MKPRGILVVLAGIAAVVSSSVYAFHPPSGPLTVQERRISHLHHPASGASSATVLKMADAALPRSRGFFDEDRFDIFSPVRRLFEDVYPSSSTTPVAFQGEFGSSPSHLFASSAYYDDVESPGRDGDEFGYATTEREEMFPPPDDGVGVDLSYLPRCEIIPPKAEEILLRITSQYINEGITTGSGTASSPVDLDEVLDMIDEEYAFSTAPFSLGSLTVNEKMRGYSEEEVEAAAAASKILSFAALHRIPSDVALLLFGKSLSKRGDDVQRNMEDTSIEKYASAFEIGGWTDVNFPRGLSLRLKRKHMTRRRERYSILPQRLSAEESALAIDEAAHLAPPIRRQSKESILASMDEELTVKPHAATLTSDWPTKDLNFFPHRKRLIRRISSRATDLREKLKDAGRGGLISYGVLNSLWYSVALLWNWTRSTATGPPWSEGAKTAVRMSLEKFGKVLLLTYVGSQVTKLPRLWLSVALAPAGNRLLRFTERKLRISENRAFTFVVGALLGSFFTICAVLVLGEATLSSLSSSVFVV